MRRLSVQIYLTIIVALLVFVVVAGAFWRSGVDRRPARQAFEVAGELASIALAAKEAPTSEQQTKLDDLARKLKLDLSLFSAKRVPIAAAGKPLQPPPQRNIESGFVYRRGGPTFAISLPDGRWLVARAPRRRHRHPAFKFIVFLSTIAALVALSAWPVVRGLTRRLENLQSGVDRFGTGDLTARVDVSGKDEVASLARSFNAAASRIERLVEGHKLLLANASHELRTPLSRIRLGVELMKEQPTPERRTALEKDLSELDVMIEEILLLSRLDSGAGLEAREDVDVLALAAEEAAHYEGCEVSGTPLTVFADARLLRRLIRNLLQNALAHAAPPIAIEVTGDDGKVIIDVTDGGKGLPPKLKDTVFEPFHRGSSRGKSGGTGLGLALVRQIAESHNGTAEFVPGPDGATLNRVRVVLPQ